jgi:hypothetical protein
VTFSSFIELIFLAHPSGLVLYMFNAGDKRVRPAERERERESKGERK